MIRFVSILLSVVLFSSIARADTASLGAALRLTNPRLARLNDDAHDARVLRNTGIVATVMGTVFTIVGSALIASNFCVDDCGSGTGGSVGAALVGLGQASSIAGIGMWAVGAKRASAAEQAKLSVSASGVRLTF
jgi:hypothetical protein